jgi:hypothetical protein
MTLSGFFSVACESEDSEVVALRGSAGEHHIATLSADHGSYQIARVFNGRPSSVSVDVSATSGVTEIVVEITQDFVAHSRIERGRGRAIHVNRGSRPVHTELRPC